MFSMKLCKNHHSIASLVALVSKSHSNYQSTLMCANALIFFFFGNDNDMVSNQNNCKL
jgi:hypothetical protein